MCNSILLRLDLVHLFLDPTDLLLLDVFTCLAFDFPTSESLSQLTLPQALAASLALFTLLAVADDQDVQRVLVLIRDPGVQMRVRLLPGAIPGPPPQQTRDAMNVRIDREALPPQTEQQHAARRLGPHALEAEHLAHGVLVAGLEQVVQRVRAVPLPGLVQDVDDDLGLALRQAAALDGLLQLGLAAVHDGVPPVAAAVRPVHGQLGARAVLVARVLAQDRPHQRVQHRPRVAAASAARRRHHLLGPVPVAVQAHEDLARQLALLGRRVRKVRERRRVAELGVLLQLLGLEVRCLFRCRLCWLLLLACAGGLCFGIVVCRLRLHLLAWLGW